jgi:hypothetical protein
LQVVAGSCSQLQLGALLANKAFGCVREFHAIDRWPARDAGQTVLKFGLARVEGVLVSHVNTPGHGQTRLLNTPCAFLRSRRESASSIGFFDGRPVL